jgi:hypothetical protein
MDQPRWLIQQLLWHPDKIGSWRWARVASVLCKLFNLRRLISHLTNSNDCGNIRPKVLLTVSPFRLLLRPALHFHSRSNLPASPLSTAFLPRAKSRGTPLLMLSPLSTAFTPIRSLTPLSTVFTQNIGGGVSRMLLRDDRGVGLSLLASHWLRVTSHGSKAITSFGINTCKSVSKQRTLSPAQSTLTQNPRGVGVTTW